MENKIDYLIELFKNLKDEGAVVFELEINSFSREAMPYDAEYNPNYRTQVPTGEFSITISGQRRVINK